MRCPHHRVCLQASFAEQLKAAPQQLQAKWKLKQLVTSAFNPLRYCSENVVQEFARVTRNLKLVDCEPVLQANLKLTSVKAVRSVLPRSCYRAELHSPVRFVLGASQRRVQAQFVWYDPPSRSCLRLSSFTALCWCRRRRAFRPLFPV